MRSILLAAVREEPLLRATIECTAFREPDASGRVVAQVRSERRMHHDRMKAPELQQKLAAFLSRAYGRTITIAVDASTEPQKSTSSAPPPGPKVQGIVQRLSGRVVEVDPVERRPAAPPPEGEPDVPPPEEPES